MIKTDEKAREGPIIDWVMGEGLGGVWPSTTRKTGDMGVLAQFPHIKHGGSGVIYRWQKCSQTLSFCVNLISRVPGP